MDYQGLTIQFNGDASGLLATLRQIDGVTTETQRSLSQVTKALKLDPSSAALYASQSKLIRRDYDDRATALNKLRSNYEDYTNKISGARSQLVEAQRQLDAIPARINRINSTLPRTTEEQERSLRAISSISEEYNEAATRRQRLLEGLREHEQSDSPYVNNIRERLRATESYMDSLSREADMWQDKFESAAKWQDECNDRLHEIDDTQKNLVKTQEDLPKQIEAWENEQDKLNDQIAITEAEMKAVREEMARLDVSKWLNATSFGQFFASLGKGGAALSGVGDKLIHIGTRATAAEAAFLGMFGRQVISEAEEYGNAISQVGGYLDLVGPQLEQMSELALYWGKETQFSATEAADAMSELAKGGMSDAQIKGGALEATMQLAAAGGISMADAATVAVNAIKVFGLGAEDATTVADALAGAANKSTAEIGSLASSFRYVSGWAGLAEYDIHDVAGALGLLADHGLQAEMAGTGLRNFMQRLGAPTGKAKDLLDEYGVSVYDASGKMKSLAELVDELNTAFGDLSDEERNETLNTIFGARALPAAIALMSAGRDELEGYIAATEREGYALEMMQARMGDLGWALEYLRGEFETFKVNIGKAMEPFIIEVVNAIEDLLSKFNNWDTGKQREFVTNMLRFAAIGPSLLAIGSAMKVIGGGMVTISRVATAIKMFSVQTGSAGLALEALTGGALSAGSAVAALAGGIAAVAAVVGVGLFVKYTYDQKKAQERTERFAHSTQGLIDTLDDIHTGNAIHDIELFSESVRTTTEDIDGMIQAQSDLVDTISERNTDAQDSINELERARRIIMLYGTSVDDLTQQQLGELEWALRLVNEQLGTNYQYNADLHQIYGEEGESIDGLVGHIDDLIRAREREIQAEAVQANMRDLYQAQSKWMAKRAELQQKYAEQSERVAEAERAMLEAEAGRDYSGGEGDQAYAEAQRSYQEARAEQQRLRSEIIETNTEIAATNSALEEYARQLAEIMGEEISDAEKLSEALGILSSTGDEVGDHISEFMRKLVDMPDDGIDNIEQLGAALADAGFNMESLSRMTQDELAAMLEQSTSVDDFIAKMVEWSNTHSTAKADVEGVDEAQDGLEQVKEDADELDGTTATVRVRADGNVVDGSANEQMRMFGRTRLSKKTGTAELTGSFFDFMRKLLPEWRGLSLGSKSGSANVSGNLHSATSDLKEWNRLGMESKWGKATIALAIQSKGVKNGLADGGMLYRHADGYITNHSIFTSGHLVGEAGIEAVLPLNNRAATRPLTDTIADGVARRVTGGDTFNITLNYAAGADANQMARDLMREVKRIQLTRG